jgi:glycosyltransferase involved in cell wall biosynthesis
MAKFIFKNYKINFFEKTSIIAHSYDKDYYQKKKREDKSKKKIDIVLSYFGSLNKKRSPSLLIKAIAELKLKKLIPDKVKTFFYGNLDSFLTNKNNIMKKQLNKNKIYFCPLISFKKSVEEMLKSDILISIDAANNENIYLTSKNIFYLPTKKLVLNITQKKSPNYYLGKKAGYLFADVLNYNDIKKKIVKSIFDYKKFKINSYFIKNYSSDIIANKWYKLFNKIFI